MLIGSVAHATVVAPYYISPNLSTQLQCTSNYLINEPALTRILIISNSFVNVLDLNSTTISDGFVSKFIYLL